MALQSSHGGSKISKRAWLLLGAVLQWQPDGCGDKCTNGSSCPHPSIGQSHPDTTDVSEWHEYAVEYSADHIHYAFDGEVFQKVEDIRVPKVRACVSLSSTYTSVMLNPECLQDKRLSFTMSLTT